MRLAANGVPARPPWVFEVTANSEAFAQFVPPLQLTSAVRSVSNVHTMSARMIRQEMDLMPLSELLGVCVEHLQVVIRHIEDGFVHKRIQMDVLWRHKDNALDHFDRL